MATATQTILIHYSEIGLKGKNQPRFREQLRQNIAVTLRNGGIDWSVAAIRGHLYVVVPPGEESQVPEATRLIGQVFGVAWLTQAQKLPHGGFGPDTQASDLRTLEKAIVALAKKHKPEGRAFCVRAKRASKILPFTSSELEARLGEVIITQSDWDRVNLSNPDVVFRLELLKDFVYLFSVKEPGLNGLPVGSTGSVMALLSGGIDSPVAAFLMAKRGCTIDYLHFTATAMQQSEAEKYKVTRLAQYLSRFTLRSRLFLVPYTHFDIALLGEKIPYDLIVFRRFMARVGERLAVRTGAEALVTGDNLAQVASQTLSNIVSTSQATQLPILRPLLTYGKNEIVELARRIGTFEDSIEPYKDCCSLISRHPRTKSDHKRLQALEQNKLHQYDELIDRTLAEAICLHFEHGKQVSPQPAAVATEE